MKKLLTLLFIVPLCTALFAQPVTLTFTGRDANNQYVQLNRVLVKNITQGWQETLFWPDTVLIMQSGTGIDDVVGANDHSLLKLSQNNPNPFEGTTNADLIIVKSGDVTVEITDVIGRVVGTKNFSSLQQGTHQLRVTLSSAGMFFLTARQNGQTAAIKMVNRGNGGVDDIAIVNKVGSQFIASESPKTSSAPKNTTDNIFHSGDQMEFVGFSTINNGEMTSIRITQAQNGSQNFTMQFSVAPVPDAQPCPGVASVTDFEGNSYTTVQIGSQCWLKKSLRTTHYADGTEIPMVDSTSYTEPLRYMPNNSTSYVSAYGYLYNWAAVMHGESSSNGSVSGVQGICPTGWHVPSKVECSQLNNYVGNNYACNNNYYSIGKALSSKTGWTVMEGDGCLMGNNPSTNNATGFSAYPAGAYPSVDSWGYDSGFGYMWCFWSATEWGSLTAYIESLSTSYYSSEVVLWSGDKNKGLSVRCVRDNGLANVRTNFNPTFFRLPVVEVEGEVIDGGEGEIIARGICWGTEPSPTIMEGNHTVEGTGLGSFTSSITGLVRGVTYYVRAYAINSIGTVYGEEYSGVYTCYNNNDGQPCSNTATLSDVDGNTYNTVQIGDQCWMKENLRTTKYANGVSIPVGTSTSTTTAYRYAPNNDESMVFLYGYLYNWTAMMHGSNGSESNPSGVQGICPTGWHVPSKAEWHQLRNYREHKVSMNFPVTEL